MLCRPQDTNVSRRNIDDNTPLSLAAAKGYADSVAILCGYANTEVNAVDSTGNTALMRAVQLELDESESSLNYLGVIEKLCKHPNVQPNIQDELEWSPLARAADRGALRPGWITL